jgi:hypothetical protein
LNRQCFDGSQLHLQGRPMTQEPGEQPNVIRCVAAALSELLESRDPISNLGIRISDNGADIINVLPTSKLEFGK